jgi:hypothetical protein
MALAGVALLVGLLAVVVAVLALVGVARTPAPLQATRAASIPRPATTVTVTVPAQSVDAAAVTVPPLATPATASTPTYPPAYDDGLLVLPVPTCSGTAVDARNDAGIDLDEGSLAGGDAADLVLRPCAAGGPLLDPSGSATVRAPAADADGAACARALDGPGTGPVAATAGLVLCLRTDGIDAVTGTEPPKIVRLTVAEVGTDAVRLTAVAWFAAP